MKFKILQNKLKEGFSIVERVISKTTTLPILNNIQIKTSKNFLQLIGTNLEIGLKWWVLAKIEKEGEIVIPGRLLSNFLSFLPNKILSISAKNNVLEIECENYKTEIKGFGSEDFPLIPKVNNEQNVIFLDSPFFCQALNQITDFVSPSIARPEISGVLFLFQKDILKLTATDSFRLGEKTLFLEKPLGFESSFILPQKTAKEIVNIFGNREGRLKISFNLNQVLFELPMVEISHPQIHFFSRLIDGEYPKYQEIIPKKYETQIIVDRNEFLNHIKIASFFSSRINEVKLKINPKKTGFDILSQNPETGNYHSFLPAKIKGKDTEVSFNHRFLIEGISHIKSSEIIFELNGESGPAVLKPVGDESFIYVVMPIKLS